MVLDPTRGLWVLLRHVLPDTSWHYDLMILSARQSLPDPNDRCLSTLRVPSETASLPGAGGGEGFEAIVLVPHRARYLNYQGPVSGGRGHVELVSRGEAASIGQDALSVCLVLGNQVYNAAAPAGTEAVSELVGAHLRFLKANAADRSGGSG